MQRNGCKRLLRGMAEKSKKKMRQQDCGMWYRKGNDTSAKKGWQEMRMGSSVGIRSGRNLGTI